MVARIFQRLGYFSDTDALKVPSLGRRILLRERRVVPSIGPRAHAVLAEALRSSTKIITCGLIQQALDFTLQLCYFSIFLFDFALQILHLTVLDLSELQFSLAHILLHAANLARHFL